MNTKLLHALVEHNLAGILFTQMFAETGKYTVVPLAYHDAINKLTVHKNNAFIKKVLANIEDAPGFLLIHPDGSLHVVEAFVSKSHDPQDLGDFAHNLLRRWEPSSIFIATPHGFYFEETRKVRDVNGHIKTLSEKIIRKEIQEKYLDILNYYL